MRRRLHFSADEWRALPWWQTRLYLEGLNEEFTPSEVDVTETGEPVQIVSTESVGIRWS